MKAKYGMALLLVVLGLGAFHLSQPQGAEPAHKEAVTLMSGKVEEAEAKGELGQPHFGYVGDIGVIAAEGKNAEGREAHAAFVVHHYPEQEKYSLGCTKLKYVGPKRLGNIDGWVFSTEWDGKAYPSKVFVSADQVYFGGGRQAYISADYRTETGWAWKLIPLRRMEITGHESR